MEDSLKSVLTLADQKYEIILKILDKTQEQSLALQEQDIEKLTCITDSKQELIDSFDAVNDTFNRQYHAVKDQGRAEEITVPLKEKIYQISQVMDQIYELELTNKSGLTLQMDEVKKNIQQTNNGKKGFQAYFQKGFQSGSYIDRKN